MPILSVLCAWFANSSSRWYDENIICWAKVRLFLVLMLFISFHELTLTKEEKEEGGIKCLIISYVKKNQNPTKLN